MRETITEEVSVVMYYSANNLRFWDKRTYCFGMLQWLHIVSLSSCKANPNTTGIG